jgi:serine protease AprX
LPALEAQNDAQTLDPGYVPFYTHMSGTSMATPHVAGITALMFEANPNLTPAQVKDIIQHTATNMTGRLAWEAGAGHINAYAAVAQAAGIRSGWGGTVNFFQQFHANSILLPETAPTSYAINFTPVGTVNTESFTVPAGMSWVKASADTDSTVAIVLTDPDGNRYGSSIGLIAPAVGNDGHITTGAPGKPGVWTVTVRGIGSVSGVALDPAKVTNGYAAPGTVNVNVSYLPSGGYTGMDDVANHPALQAIQFAVAYRLVDGFSDNKFRPDATITRGQLAQYLMMGQSVRQYLPFSGVSSFTDVAPGDAVYPYAESVVAKGAPLRDLTQANDGVMGTVNGAFRPNDSVTRVSLAYSLVQSAGRQDVARGFSGPLTVMYNGQRIAIDDAASIPAVLQGYVQQALDLGFINARFAVTQGPYDLQPTMHAYFDPSNTVTRAAFAVAAGRYLAYYQQSAK